MDEQEIDRRDSSEIYPKVLMPLPDHDFDPTEAAIPWKLCTSHGMQVVISTEHGYIPQTDLNRLNGPLPGLISAGANVKSAYKDMTQDPLFQNPIPYAEIEPNQFDALLLPGGDAPRMRQYLDSELLRSKVLGFWQQGKLIGAICHGMLVIARTIDPQTGRSVLYGHKVTAIPSSLDKLAYRLDHWLTKHGYIMYDQCVSDEVRSCLARPEDFSRGPGLLAPFAVTDGNLVTARWYMDAELFTKRFIDQLDKLRNVPIK
jgi:putative intracellular protease/amidase